MGIIYRALFPNGKSYIGQTSRNNIEQRKKEHKRDQYFKINKFYSAMKKYGYDNIEWFILEECDNSLLNKKEIYYINKYRTYIGWPDCNGYNMTERGSDINNCIFNEKEIKEILEEYKLLREIKAVAENRKCGYTAIYNILSGQTYSEITHIEKGDKNFLKKYKKKGIKYTNEQIEAVIQKNKEGLSNLEISIELDVPVKWIQDILSGRTLSKKTGISHVTREERQKYNPVNSKRSKEQILNMVNDYYNEKLTFKSICEKYNIPSARLSEILSGKTWKEITFLTKEKYLIEKDKRETLKENKKISSNKPHYSDEDVLNMVKLYNQGFSKKQIAEKYKTTEGYIYKIVTGERRNNITHIK